MHRSGEKKPVQRVRTTKILATLQNHQRLATNYGCFGVCGQRHAGMSAKKGMAAEA